MKKFYLFLALIYFPVISNASKIHPITEQQVYFDKKAEEIRKQTDSYQSRLLNQALQQKLYQDPVWESLILYKDKWFGGIRSQVDGANFFLSQTGHIEPQKELIATLTAFFEDRIIQPGKYSAQCTFPARFFWLNQKLNFDPNELSFAKCEDLQKMRKLLNPNAITVVFPSTHPNSPSSMFGHTLLRFDSEKNQGDSAMLNFTVNYAAEIAQNVSSMSYAVRGIAGGFPGRFRFVPYYLKLREYSQMENRDLWEYTLNLQPSQIDFILYHAYELSGAQFDYYFFTENCSYHLLSLLDIAFGDNKLTDEFSGWTIPIDTVKSMEKRGLIAKVNYQPSLTRRINTGLKQLDLEENKLIKQIYRDGIDPHLSQLASLNEDRQIILYDLLSDLFRYRKLKTAKNKVDSNLNKEERKVLLARSKIKKRSTKLNIFTPDIRPDKGHGTARTTFSFNNIADNNYFDLEWRPAYHDISDPSSGFSHNTSVEFFTLKARYEEEEEKLELNQFQLLSILSLEPRHGFFKNYSWYVEMGWQRLQQQNHDGMRYLNVGGGLTYLLPKRSYIYTLPDINIRGGRIFEKDYSLMAGFRFGLISEPLKNWRLHFETNYKKGVLGDNSRHLVHSATQSVRITRNSALKIFYKREYLFELERDQYGMGFAFYY